jgi:hypothetical protein
MIALRQFFAKHNLPEPEGIEFRFSDELAAHNFESALKMEFDRENFTVDIKEPRRISEVRGFKIQSTFQRHGPPYSTTMLPAHHPARSRERR